MEATKWQTTVTAIGPEVSAFLDENVLVLFDTSAPEELAEFAVLHPPAPLHEPVGPGDTLLLGEEAYRVTGVGPVANDNLARLGHIVLKCNGLSEVEMPGDMSIEEKALPPITVGMSIRILATEESRS